MENVACIVFIVHVKVRDLWTKFLLLWALVIGPRGDSGLAVCGYQNVCCQIDLGLRCDVSLLGRYFAYMAIAFIVFEAYNSTQRQWGEKA